MAVYRTTALTVAVAMVLASVTALVVDDETWDTVLGGVAGASATLLLGCLLGLALERRRRRGVVDAESLDRLEPLRAARRDGA